MNNRTHRQTQLLMDNHQLSKYNFNILLEYIYSNLTHGQPDTLTDTTLSGQPPVVQF